MPDSDVTDLATKVLAMAREAGAHIATAESCTGGLIAAALTEVAGSSDVFERGYVTYSNAAKEADLGVADTLLEKYGAVSAEVARAMASGARLRSGADFAVSVTGIAGPGGGSAAKPVGLVHMAVAGPAGCVQEEHRFGDPGRTRIREVTVIAALNLLLSVIGKAPARSVSRRKAGKRGA